MGKAKELSPTEKFCQSNVKSACPDRIVDNAISGLFAGLVGGAAYRAVLNLWKNRGLEMAAQDVVLRAPAIALSCGIVLAVYSALECATERLRDKRDEANCFIAGAATGALLGRGRGMQAMAVNGALGAVAFGVVDGVLRKEFCGGK